MIPLGDIPAGVTYPFGFPTYGASNESITITGLAVTDIEIYKAGGTTQRASDNGFTLLDTDGIDFDSTTGIHGFSVDFSDNSDSGFYAAGSYYWLVVNAITVNAQTVRLLYTFRLVAAESVSGTPKADVSHFGGTAGTFASGRPEVNATHVGGTSQTAKDLGAINVTNLNTLSGHDPGATIGTSTLTQAQVSGGAYALNSSSFAFNSGLDLTTTQKSSVATALTNYDALVPGDLPISVTLADGSHGGTSAVITAERIVVASTTTNQPGFKITGNGSAPGMLSTGGTTGEGIKAVGGASGGEGIHATASGGNASGFASVGVGGGDGITAHSGGTGSGFYGYSDGGGHGIVGAATDTGNGHGFYGMGIGSGHGYYGTGGATGDGMHLLGGANGDGFDAVGQGTGVDIRGDITGDVTGTASGNATAAALAALVTTVGAAGAGLTEAGGTGDQLTAITSAIAALNNLSSAQAQSAVAAALTAFGAALESSVQSALTQATNAATSAAAADLRGQRVVARGTVGSASTTTNIVTSACSPSGAVADQFKGRIVVFDYNTTTAALRGQVTDITASSNAATPELTVTALTTAPASGDTFTIV